MSFTMYTLRMRFVIAGLPITKQLRAAKRSDGSPFIFTTHATKRYQELVRITAEVLFPSPMDGALRVAALFVFGSNDIPTLPAHIRKQDVDNLTKALLDGLTGVAFSDDRQVVDVHSVKANGADFNVASSYTFVSVEAARSAVDVFRWAGFFKPPAGDPDEENSQ